MGRAGERFTESSSNGRPSHAPRKLKPKSKIEKKKKKKEKFSNVDQGNENLSLENSEANAVQEVTPANRLSFFLDMFQSANGVRLSSLELESLNDGCKVDGGQDFGDDDKSLANHLKSALGSSWKETLCGEQILEGKIDPGSPAVLIVSSSALRSIALLRGLRSFTQKCHAVKLFSKHMKIDEQVSLLKSRVNIAGGTPSRIKKLIDTEALGLSRLAVLVIDLHQDVKGYSVLTLPQIRDEFWDVYKHYFHQRLLQGNTSLCLFGPLLTQIPRRKKDLD